MAIEIRLLEDHELPVANKFFNDTYKTNRSQENFNWEFLNGPAGKALYVAAIDTDASSFKIVGIQSAIPLEMIGSDGRKLLTAKSEDTLVDPAYRGQKLFERMYEVLFQKSRERGIVFIWGFTPAVKAFQRIGFEAPFQTSQALMVFKPQAAFKYLSQLNATNGFLEKMKIAGLCMYSFTKAFRPSFGNTSPEPNQLNAKDRLFAELFGAQKKLVTLLQNESYIQWRIVSNPYGNQYINLFVKKNGTIADILVNKRPDVSYLEQMMFSPNNLSTDNVQLIREAARFLKKKGSPLIRVLCFDNNAEMRKLNNELKAAGFTYLKRGNYFVWKTLNPDTNVSVGDIFFSRLFTQGNL